MNTDQSDLTRWDEPNALAGRADRASVDRLLALLADEDPALRWRAGEAIAETAARLRKHAHLGAVRPTSESPNYAFSELLARMGAALHSSDAALRGAAADALALWDHDAAVELLREALQDSDPQVRANTVRALGRIGEPDSIRWLESALGDDSVWVRRAAADALGCMGARASVGRLEETLTADQPIVRAAVVAALGHIQSARARGLLERATQDADPDIRWYAARSLGQMGDRASCAALADLRREEGVLLFGQTTRQVAEEAMAAIQKRDRGLVNRIRRAIYTIVRRLRRAPRPVAP